jgi:hypothetical protein
MYRIFLTDYINENFHATIRLPAAGRSKHSSKPRAAVRCFLGERPVYSRQRMISVDKKMSA